MKFSIKVYLCEWGKGSILKSKTLLMGSDMSYFSYLLVFTDELWLQEIFPTMGRICCDCNGHLNPASVLIEGCSEPGRNNCVPVDLSRVDSFSIFPGQVIITLVCMTSS